MSLSKMLKQKKAFTVTLFIQFIQYNEFAEEIQYVGHEITDVDVEGEDQNDAKKKAIEAFLKNGGIYTIENIISSNNTPSYDSDPNTVPKYAAYYKDTYISPWDAKHSLYCISKSPKNDFVIFCCDLYAGKEEEHIIKQAAEIFWNSLSTKLKELNSENELSDAISVDAISVDAISNEDKDKFILNCFYAFPAIKQEILLDRLIKVEPKVFNVVKTVEFYDSLS
mgnify:CR=1 FL=1